MNMSRVVQRQVNRIAPGQLFGYRDLPAFEQAPATVMKAVSRLVQDNKVMRFSKGKFYVPQQGLLGQRKPSDGEMLKSVLFRDGALRGYVTGVALYNQLGLTTQVPKTYTVAVAGSRQIKDFGTIRVKAVVARAPIKPNDVPLLQYLDVLRDLKRIPDASTTQSLTIMAKKIKALAENRVGRLQFLAMNYYSAQTRALLGLVLSHNQQLTTDKLKASLNPATRYTIDLDTAQWPNTAAWNIKS